jgi:hypothetical protein
MNSQQRLLLQRGRVTNRGPCLIVYHGEVLDILTHRSGRLCHSNAPFEDGVFHGTILKVQMPNLKNPVARAFTDDHVGGSHLEGKKKREFEFIVNLRKIETIN